MYSPKGIKFQLHRQHLKHFLKHEKRMFSKRLVFCVFNSTSVWVPDNRLRLAANKEKLSTSRLFGKLAEINQQMNWKERRRISPFEKQLFKILKIQLEHLSTHNRMKWICYLEISGDCKSVKKKRLKEGRQASQSVIR